MAVANALYQVFERTPVPSLKSDPGKDSPFRCAMVAVVKHRDIKSITQAGQEFKQSTRAFWKLETVQLLTSDTHRPAAYHMPYMKHREFIIRKIGNLIATLERPNELTPVSIICGLDTDKDTRWAR